MVKNAALADRLEAVVRALEVLAATRRSDVRTIASRSEAVRTAGAAFDELLMERCVSYTPVFAQPLGEYDRPPDKGDAGRPALPAGTRVSIQIREDFVLVDEAAFRASTRRIFARKGPWPPDVQPDEDDVLRQLEALVDRIGLQETAYGMSVKGIENAGGETTVVVVDSALGDDW